MSELLNQLGVDWHLLLSQAVNFALLLIVLRIFVYKPVIKLMHDRRARIEEGITKAEEADRRLLAADEMKKMKIKEGEAQALALMKKTEDNAKAREAQLLAEAKRKEAEAIKNTEAILKSKEEESQRAAEAQAAALVRQAIVKTVEMAPEKIDDALIERAITEAKKAV